MRYCSLMLLLIVFRVLAASQPIVTDEGIRFSLKNDSYAGVSLVGDFNGWSLEENRMGLDSSGTWFASRKVQPGLYQYKFVADGIYLTDPGNPASVENFDRTSRNSVFVMKRDGTLLLSSAPPDEANESDAYTVDPGLQPLYLNLIWHQHQPLYVDPVSDQLKGPWVRTHATKDYYDMAAILLEYPDVHCTINLTSSLLLQLNDYYLRRLGPFVDTESKTVDVEGYFKAWGNKTDPWIDLALKPTSSFTQEDKNLMYRNAWNAFGISEVLLRRFPEYEGLKQRLDVDQMPGFDVLNEQQLREAKFWFYAAHFDPDFLRGPVTLADGEVCDLSDLLEEGVDGRYRLRRKVTEEDCRRMVAEAFTVMKNIIPVHRKLMYRDGKGQIDVITTPYYHPILPLVYDSDLARRCQPEGLLPARFAFPGDASAQVAKSVRLYEELFCETPRGMWPAEGAVAQSVLPLFAEHGIEWIASDVKVLTKSLPSELQLTSLYSFPAGEDASIAVAFRHTGLSDRIGFTYQGYEPEAAAEDFVQTLLARRVPVGSPERLETVILDGENAWEWYSKDHDAKKFLHALYRKLSRLYTLGLVVTTTMSEYIDGNPARGVGSHPPEQIERLDRLHEGSWINANYDTWIGEEEENRAWEYLLITRNDLAASGIERPDPDDDPPDPTDEEWNEYMAWESMYAAEGSDWFWWYGADQSAPGGEMPFDIAFRTHLENVYRFIRGSGREWEERRFDPIISGKAMTSGQGAMAMSTRRILFTCDMKGQVVHNKVFIAGNLNELGGWTPNLIPMFDDGTNGDLVANDGIWSLAIRLPVGEEVRYKYTNSGIPGLWNPGEEFPAQDRVLVLPEAADTLVVRDIFGIIAEQE